MRELARAVGGAVPIPNRFFDEVMPMLKDTEMRVLLCVFRATFGFREGSPSGGWRHKERDWISHAQLCRRTGRGSDAVSKAVDALVRQGLVVTEDASGRTLKTSEERRRFVGRLYFRPGDMWKTGQKSRPAKAGTTTNTHNNKKGTSPRTGGWQRAVRTA